MKKIFFLVIALISLLLLSSCQVDDIEVVYDLDTKTMEIIADSTMVSYYNSEYFSMKTVDDKTAIIIDCKKFSNENKFHHKVIYDLKRVFPKYEPLLDVFELNITQKYFGTLVFGTEYFDVNIKSEIPFDFQMRFKSKNDFVINGNVSNYDNNEYSLLVNMKSNDDGEMILNIQNLISEFNALSIQIDISKPSPSVQYVANISHNDYDLIADQLVAIGLSVSYCDNGQIVFYETYDTCDDFQYMFPIRTYTLFGFVLTTELEYKEYFIQSCDFKMVVPAIELDKPIKLSVISSNHAYYDITVNGTADSFVGDKYEFDVGENVELAIQYENVRWGAMISSLVVFIGILVIMFVMIFLLKRRVYRRL